MTERMSITETPSSFSADGDSCEDGLKFQIQIGLVREQICLPINTILTLPALRELCCSFVDRKVRFMLYVQYQYRCCSGCCGCCQVQCECVLVLWGMRCRCATIYVDLLPGPVCREVD